MALQTSGPISFSDIAAEFGDVAPHSMSEFYRDGGLVPGVNTNVPLAGLIRFGQFYGAVNELVIQATAQASLNAQTLFGPEWSNAIPKRLIVPAGVTIGPMTIPSGLGGTLVVQNEGEIQGLGGAANGGAGGHAITASSSFTLENTGAVRGGGGGGGKGGTGGQGSYVSTSTQGPLWSASTYEWYDEGGGWVSIYWGGFVGLFSVGGATSYGAYTRGPQYSSQGAYYIYRTTSSTVYTSGGAGGNGGVGRGYGQAPASGLGGAAGGTNAGVGGTGGAGAEWGAAGNTGGTGANGNYTGGLAGSAGGAAGKAVEMLAGTLTLNNNGTINGATA